MKRLMLVAVIAAIAAPTWLTALTKSYDVVPYKNCIAQTDTAWPNNRVSQYYRNTLDELTRIDVWIGDTFSHSGFNVGVFDSAFPTHRLAYAEGVVPTQPWAWLRFDLTPETTYKLTRGRTYKVVVTRPSGGAVSFAYCDTNPYKYGWLTVGSIAHGYWDLAARTAI